MVIRGGGGRSQVDSAVWKVWAAASHRHSPEKLSSRRRDIGRGNRLPGTDRLLPCKIPLVGTRQADIRIEDHKRLAGVRWIESGKRRRRPRSPDGKWYSHHMLLPKVWKRKRGFSDGTRPKIVENTRPSPDNALPSWLLR